MPAAVNNNQLIQPTLIANAASVSAAIALQGNTLVGLVFPAGLTTGTARFQVSVDGTAYVPLNDDGGTRIAVPAVASTANSLKPSIFAGWPFVKIDLAAAVAADTTILILSRPV
jgi:hypothetical protein